jgi:hypothetical protein
LAYEENILLDEDNSQSYKRISTLRDSSEKNQTFLNETLSTMNLLEAEHKQFSYKSSGEIDLLKKKLEVANSNTINLENVKDEADRLYAELFLARQDGIDKDEEINLLKDHVSTQDIKYINLLDSTKI